jgi:hypothetical protein
MFQAGLRGRARGSAGGQLRAQALRLRHAAVRKWRRKPLKSLKTDAE